MDFPNSYNTQLTYSPLNLRQSNSAFHQPSRMCNTNNANQNELSVFYRRYRDKPRIPISHASFYKSCSSINAMSSFIKKNYAETPSHSSASASASMYSFNTFPSSNLSSFSSITNEKEKREAIKKIITYLSYKNYPYEVNPKILSSPSRKDVIELWNFLFKQIDSHVVINSVNANDEIPKYFKETGYPITISRSSMVAPGASHQWSQHLNAITWLCELLIYEDEAFPNILNEPQSDQQFSLLNFLKDGFVSENVETPLSLLNKLIVEKYKLYLANDESLDALTNAILTRLEENINELRENIDNKNRTLEKLQNNLLAIQKELNESEQMKTRNNTLNEEIKKLKTHLEAAEDTSTNLDMNIKLEKQRQDEKISKIKALEEDIEKVKEQIAKQGISREEVHTLQEDIKRQKEYLKVRTEEVKDLEKKLMDHCEINQKEVCLIRIEAENCNKTLNDIKDLSRKGKIESFETWQDIKTFQISNIGHNSLNDVLGLDWKSFKEEIQNLINTDEQNEKKLRNEILTLKMSLEDAKNDCKKKQEEITLLIQEEKNELNRLKNFEKEVRNKHKNLLDECDRINSATIDSVEEKENELRLVKNELQDKKDLLIKIKENNDKIILNKKAKYTSIFSEILSTKQFVKENLQDWKNFTTESCSEIIEGLKGIIRGD